MFIAKKWRQNNLTWKTINFTPDLGKEKTRCIFISSSKKLSQKVFFLYYRRVIANAFKYWAEVTSLKFAEACESCNANLIISFNYGNHGDDAPFDGQGLFKHYRLIYFVNLFRYLKGGTLAHASFPEVFF